MVTQLEIAKDFSQGVLIKRLVADTNAIMTGRSDAELCGSIAQTES